MTITGSCHCGTSAFRIEGGIPLVAGQRPVLPRRDWVWLLLPICASRSVRLSGVRSTWFFWVSA